MAEDIPAGASASVGDTGLEKFVGLPIEKICPTGFGITGDAHNHCAHFVCHALRYTAGTGVKCSGMDKSKGNKRPKDFKQMGALIRVNEFYRSVKNKKKLDIAKADSLSFASGLIFVTKTSNLSNGIEIMGDAKNKHVGIIKSNMVYNYGNIPDAVLKETIPKFAARLTDAYGGNVTFITSDLP